MADMNNNQKHEDMIELLCQDLEPVQKCRNPVYCATTWFFMGILSVIIIGSVMSFRHDLIEKLTDAIFLTEVVLILSLSFSAALASAYLRVPDGEQHKYVLAFTYILGAVVAVFIGREIFLHEALWPALSFSKCMLDAIFTGVFPVVFMMLMMRGQKTTRPVLCGSLNALAAGSIGYLGLRLTCGSDAVSHVCFYHIIPFVLLGIVIGVLARRLYRW
jgi:hypothetical protein